ncbi:hypothetical protein IBE20_04545 [Francisella tularensis subsp. novicida]|uniref:Uncharacterized protein n=2 Tax=Francisella tularensis TaxID=263 RepID=A0A6I4RXQ1_FRATU|nr:hypothetical protein [Francisella tularensis]ABK89276.1 protein of unknown function [Francisella tularensis subsp. novicida U112]AJI61716.1 hypothetical protein AW25_1664 [Francisella tularensis subsp. novicida U112]EDX19143.1 hypothetical protein FTE_1433 [Francisella tularensis subsp. novicida FTE]MBK2035064.1 hypothetical protein [Francisella tularensis subsp. novicida]MBK2116344.1 hypothetical protein [Francisella tularensis subsp. novicida]
MGNKSKYQSQEPPKGFDLDYYQELHKTLKTPKDWAVAIYVRQLIYLGWFKFFDRSKKITQANFFNKINNLHINMINKFINNHENFVYHLAECNDDLLKPISYLNKLEVLHESFDIINEYKQKKATPIEFTDDLLENIEDCLGVDYLIDTKYDLNNHLKTIELDKAYFIAIKANLSAPKNLLMKEFEKLIDEVHKSDLYKDRATIKKPFSATYEQELRRLLPLIDLMLFNQHFNYTMTATQYSRFVYPNLKHPYSDNYIRDFIKRIKTTILTSEYLLWLYQNNVDL